MPTAAKLTAAITLALLAAIVSELFKPQVPEGFAFGYFSYVNMAFAAVLGWKIIGSRAGEGIMRGVNNGITSMLAMVLVLLFAHSSRLMFYNSINLRYDSTAEAIQSIFGMMLEYGLLLLTPQILTTLLVGALISGLMTEATSRRWR